MRAEIRPTWIGVAVGGDPLAEQADVQTDVDIFHGVVPTGLKADLTPPFLDPHPQIRNAAPVPESLTRQLRSDVLAPVQEELARRSRGHSTMVRMPGV